MKSTQKIIDLALTLNAAAGTLCLGSVLICTGTTIVWFATAPFVSDRTEYHFSTVQ